MAIVQTKEQLHDINLADAKDTKIYLAVKSDARNVGIDWKNKVEIHWSKYQIKETDMRVKTATFTSPQYVDLTTGVYCVLIVSKFHENFGGEIIKVTHGKDTGLYEYQCQDFSRDYQSKFELFTSGVKNHRILKFLLTRGGISSKGTISDSLKKTYKRELSGLRPAYQYEQKYWGSSVGFNPMTQIHQMIIRNKSYIEAIRDIIHSSGAYIDVYFDIYGVCHIEPYTKDSFYNKGLRITTPEFAEYKYNSDITNMVTGVILHNSDNAQGGTAYSSGDVVNLNLSVLFGSNTTSMDDPNQTNTTTSTSSTGKSSSKKAISSKKTSNPYQTKKKIAYINSDNISGRSSDLQFMNNVAKLLKKNGWKTKIIGLGANTHTEKYMKKCKNGVWLCIYGGADAAVFKEAGGKNSYTNKLKKLHSRTVICMHGGGNIRKGGKYYKWLPRAHDDNYSPSSFRGLSYPINYLTKHKVPICYGSTAEKLVAKFLAGGDNPDAD